MKLEDFKVFEFYYFVSEVRFLSWIFFVFELLGGFVSENIDEISLF